MIEYIAVVKDILTIIAAASTIYIGFSGLGAWKKKLRGTSEYDLSRRILTTIFAYRDSLNALRDPAILVHEMPSPPEGNTKQLTSEQQRFYGLSKAYENRWKEVQDERQKLYPDLLEAEALWGNEFNKVFNSLFDLEREIFIKVRHYLTLSDPDTSEPTRKAVEKANAKLRDILYDVTSAEEVDIFRKEVDSEIRKIETQLKKHLKN